MTKYYRSGTIKNTDAHYTYTEARYRVYDERRYNKFSIKRVFNEPSDFFSA